MDVILFVYEKQINGISKSQGLVNFDESRFGKGLDYVFGNLENGSCFFPVEQIGRSGEHGDRKVFIPGNGGDALQELKSVHNGHNQVQKGHNRKVRARFEIFQGNFAIFSM